ncbi:UvrD-helicase domain-containing protein [Bradyrhizobium sp. U87765 SZCCT0131]|uniref:ATP-dependent helicase n=1 Tax=unclassified Bradyrhizobium TaxID=2631580 RepID=UPI001BADFF2A|nr:MULTISPECIES: UvrD-helicase domain-containing protein [unclassified Bradyrhizobium]MBR1222312.1 UvrD-helicase domain-containing protein [Bradyrhizobium sp. U87765 SZCCT0131]MBR1264204.1 UvrD-helicase domain-containing protein [Bradyrhizobium sp. U87765 SZCCT0134]MBR1308013.1 UvrD-helicase domain-containing protein [Bradyrhizobium sp. U87765 SZCCT0110]MBR1320454.1 UvrD-helicase domain-containing protein [Bradyrhizobium sp. U87765 SZCCT0109]MBR1348433.1 UvrD-helicase domain-containing protein
MTDPIKLSPFDVPAHQPAPGGIAARARAAAAPQYLAVLNPEQRAAVETLDGPVLVLAGAGTGKTRVLTSRIAHILTLGRARPAEILSVTFTNKAAREMKHRLGQMLGQTVEGMPWLGTFHSIGGRILRYHAELVGLKSNFTVLDVDDQIRLLKQLLQAEGIDEKRWPARMLAGLIDGWKNRGLTPSQVPSGEAAVFANGKGGKLYATYQDRLKVLNAADFGDLLLENIRLFREHPDVLRQYQNRFKFILVDEYQDTNVAQYLWLRLLSQGASAPLPGRMLRDASREEPADSEEPAAPAPALKNICCVGDDDQSIYGWRGAEVDNILRFDHDFPGATVIRLERNYRSTGHILAAASHLISYNESRLGKTLHTEDDDGEKVTVTGAWDSEEEARAIGEEIEDLQRQQHRLNEVAILVRASFQMREFEDRFITLGLPYRVIGGPRFYERAEIRDALAYLRVINSPADDLAFERIVNVPKRGIGDATVQLLHDHARKRRIPLTEAARMVVETDELKPKARGALREVVANFDRWRAQSEVTRHTELAEIVLDESGYTDMWQKDRSADAAGRLENLKELVRSMEEFENLQGFLEHIALVMDRDGGPEEDAVSVMTLHSAKGLEFDTVFLPGWEEGLFPHQRALDEQGRAGLEEERRLAHVGITRARRRAKIYFATNRRIHGSWSTTVPSRFLDELPARNVEITESKGGNGWGGAGGYGASRFDNLEAFSSTYSTPGWQRAQQRKGGGGSGGHGGGSGGGFRESGSGFAPGGDQFGNWRNKRGGTTIEGELVAKSTGTASDFSAGDRVFHQKFGYGRVTHVDGNKLTIAFDKAGEKRVVDSFVQQA